MTSEIDDQARPDGCLAVIAFEDRFNSDAAAIVLVQAQQLSGDGVGDDEGVVAGDDGPFGIAKVGAAIARRDAALGFDDVAWLDRHFLQAFQKDAGLFVLQKETNAGQGKW